MRRFPLSAILIAFILALVDMGQTRRAFLDLWRGTIGVHGEY